MSLREGVNTPAIFHIQMNIGYMTENRSMVLSLTQTLTPFVLALAIPTRILVTKDPVINGAVCKYLMRFLSRLSLFFVVNVKNHSLLSQSFLFLSHLLLFPSFLFSFVLSEYKESPSGGLTDTR